jgi:hypothetical protein
MSVRRAVAVSVALVSLLLVGCTRGPEVDANPEMSGTNAPATSEPTASWDCPDHRTTTIVGPGMNVGKTPAAAAHVLPGPEQVRLLHVTSRTRMALVEKRSRGVIRLRLREMRGEWYIASGDVCEAPADARSAMRTRLPVLGDRFHLFLYGSGWGDVRPTRIYNGGVPSGQVRHIDWQRWGADRALGSGMTYTYTPRGGYYRQPVRIILRAQGLGHCPGSARPAYTQLFARTQSEPGGAIDTRWHGWGPRDGNICRW